MKAKEVRGLAQSIHLLFILVMTVLPEHFHKGDSESNIWLILF